MNPLTLKSKLSLTVSLLVTVLMIGFSALIISFFNQSFRENIKEHQFILVSQLASQLDNQISSAQAELVQLAKGIPPETLLDQAACGRLLADRTASMMEFDGGVSILSLAGGLVAGTGQGHGTGKLDVSKLDCFRKTVASGKPQISDPFLSSGFRQQPRVIFTAPVFDAGGRVAAVLAGGIDLKRDNFLGGLASLKSGKNGYLYLFNRDRTLIVHRDPNRIAKRDVPVGANRMFDKAITGFEGTAETVNSRGLSVLVSFKQLKSADWILAANYTLTDARAQVNMLIRYTIAATLLGIAISILLIRFIVKYLTAPLLLLTSRIKEISGKGWDRRLLPVTTRDETGELAAAFNTMMESLAGKEAELRKLSQAVEHSPCIVIITDLKGNIVYVNPKFTEVTGYSPRESVGRNPRFLKSGETSSEQYSNMWQTITAGEEWRGEFWNRRKNGEMYWASAQISSVKNGGGEMTAFIGVQEDITDRKQAEVRIGELHRQKQAILNNIPDMAWLKDRDSRYIAVNEPFARACGSAPEEVVGRNDLDLWPRELAEAYMADDQSVMESGLRKLIEEPLVDRSGNRILIETIKSPIFNEHGQVVGTAGIARDVSERKRLEDELKASKSILSELALHDNLTGLPNRRLLKERLDFAIAHADRNGGLVGLLFLDLDHFKQINDSFGHAVGDLLLKAFGEALSESVRHSDTVARLGGDEFIVMLSEIDSPDDVALVADKILDGMKNPFVLDGHVIQAGTSIGIAVYPADAENAADLINNADAALYRAKAGGRGSYRIHGNGI